MNEYSEEQIATWKANRKKWVEALRSGEYVQGQNYLAMNGTHCCLGVLCVVAGETIRHGAQHPNADAKKFVGLSDSAGSFRTPDSISGILVTDRLIDRNDCGTPFSEIADIIESEPPGLFLESVEAAE